MDQQHPLDSTEKRYDRGIRVWGIHGQAALENSRICLLTAGATGSETLKNLVLGGIHSFTIVDGRNVEVEDLGNNYCIKPSSIGSSRAAAVTEALKELNEMVSGSYVENNPSDLIDSNPEFFSEFDLVIATQLPEAMNAKLDNICRGYGVPLVLARSYGLAGMVRNCVVEHCVIESKPDSEVDDLRIANPWPKLVEAANKLDLDRLDDAEHSHIPYGLILVKAAKEWKSKYGSLPSSSDRSAFKDMIYSWQRSIDGCPIPEENFAEAINNAHKAWSTLAVSPEIERVLNDEAAFELTSESNDFWVLVAALRQFIANEGSGTQLPLEGSLPDMHSTTERYLELQRIYREKSEEDTKALARHAAKVLVSIGRDPSSIPLSEVRRFCIHARHLRVVRTRPLLDEDESSRGSSGLNKRMPSSGRLVEFPSSPSRSPGSVGNEKSLGKDTIQTNAYRMAFSSEEKCGDASVAVLFKSVDRFSSRYGKYPGQQDTDFEEDIALLKSIATNILMEEGLYGAGFLDDAVVEFVRCGAAELQVIAAIIGALAAQESIKLITQQYVPVEGTIIFNGMHSTSSVFP